MVQDSQVLGSSISDGRTYAVKQQNTRPVTMPAMIALTTIWVEVKLRISSPCGGKSICRERNFGDGNGEIDESWRWEVMDWSVAWKKLGKVAFPNLAELIFRPEGKHVLGACCMSSAITSNAYLRRKSSSHKLYSKWKIQVVLAHRFEFLQLVRWVAALSDPQHVTFRWPEPDYLIWIMERLDDFVFYILKFVTDMRIRVWNLQLS